MRIKIMVKALIVLVLVLLISGCKAPVSVPGATTTPTVSTPTAKTYEVSLYTTPAGARVWLDGEDTGQVTPCNFRAEIGEHIAVVKLNGYFEQEQRINVTNSDVAKSIILTPTDIVTLAEYQRVQSSMTYGQVVEIVGTQGEKMSENTVDLFPGVVAPGTTVMYQWTNGDGSNMIAVFQDDKLVTRSQAGLK